MNYSSTFKRILVGALSLSMTVQPVFAQMVFRVPLEPVTGAAASDVKAQVNSLSFGAVPIEQEVTQSLTFTNTGTVSAEVGTGKVEGEGFYQKASTCADYLAPGKTCVVTVAFKPLEKKDYSGQAALSVGGVDSVFVSLSGAGQSGTLELAPSSVDFSAPLQVGDAAEPVTVTVTNTGQSRVADIKVSLVNEGENRDFTQSNNCAAALAPGQSCGVAIGFTPMQAGLRQAVLAVTSDASAGIQQVAIKGQGTAASASLGTVEFGSVQTGKSKTVSAVLTNTGIGALSVTSAVSSKAEYEVSLTQCQANLASGQSCNIAVTYRPTQAGESNAVLTVETAQTGALTAALHAVAQAPGATLTTPAFTATPVTQSSAAQAVLTNTGADSIAVTPLDAGAVTGDAFSLESTTCGTTLAAGASCNIQLKFSPVAMGNKSGELSVTTDAGVRKVVLSAMATQVKFEVATDALDYGNVAVGSAGATRSLSVTNSGNLPLQGLSATSSGAFTVESSSCPAELAPAASCAFTLKFLPTASQPYAASVEVTASNALESTRVSLAGQGVQGDMALSTSGLSFSNTQVGETSSAKAVLVLNQGNSALSVGTPVVTGDYALVGNDCPAQLEPLSSCQLTVVFTPSSLSNPRNGQLTLANNGLSGAKTVSLTGTAVSQQASLSAPAFDPLLAGTTSTQTATLTNTGIGALQVTVPKSDSVSGTGFSFVSTDCTTSLSAGASCTVSVQFAPATGTAYTGSVSVDTGAGKKTVSFSASGTRAVLQVSPSSIPAFGSVQVGQSKLSEVLTISNTGTASATGLKLTPPAGYSVEGSTCGTTLTAGSTCQVNVRFSPVLAQTYAGNLLVEAAAPASNTQLAVTGSGAAQAATLNSVSFGAVTAGQSASQVATLSNTGVGPLSVGALGAAAVTGDGFAFASTTCGASLASGQSCTVTVSFNPTVNQAYEGTLKFSTGAGQVVSNLSGTGSRAVLTLTPASLTAFGNVQVGESKDSAVLTLKNTGNATASSLTLNPPAGYSVVASNCGVSLPAGNNCTFTLRFAPSVVQAYTGTFKASATASDVDATLSLSGSGVSQSATLSTVAFGNRAADSSTDLKATLTNTGAGTVTVTPPTASSVSGTGFSFVSTTCGASLSAGTACDVLIRFTPTASAEYTGQVTVATSAGVKTANLTGSGLQGAASVSVSALNFADTQVSQSTSAKSVTFTNIGTQALTVTGVSVATGVSDFGRSNNCGTTLAVGESCTVDVSFTPSATGLRQGTLVMTHNGAGSMTVVNLEGNGFAQAATLSNVDFGGVTAGSSVVQTATLTNTGIGPLSVSVPTAASVQGTGFSLTSTTCTASLAVGANCKVSLTFAPSTNADSSGTLTVVTGAGTKVSNLAGTGTRAVLSFTPSTVAAFGNVQLNDTKDSVSVQLRNTGNATASALTLKAPSGYGFQSSSCGATLAAGANCSFVIRFAPTVAQAYAGNVTATAGASDVSASLSVTGTGVAQSATLNALDFGNRAASSTTDLSTTLTNTGAGSITLTTPSSASVTGAGFSFVSTTCGTTLATTASCTVTLRFAPTANASYTGSLSITTSAGAKSANLTGQGLQGTGTASPTSLAFGNVQVGQSSVAQTVTLTNNGTQALTFTGISVVTGTADFGRSNNCGATLAVGASCTVSVSFTPSAAGDRTGVLVALHDGPGGRTDVNLAGTGVAQSATLSSVSFGNVPVGNTVQQTATLANTGIGPMSVTVPTSASVTGTGYSFVSTNCTSSLAASTSCSVTVSYAPTSNAGSNGTLTLTTGAGTLSANLSGTGTRAVLAFSPATLTAFGNVQVGQSVNSATVTLQNNGNATATGLTVTPPTGYSLQSSTCTTTLAAGTSCSFVVRFSPSAVQGYMANLIATAGTNDAGTSLALSGSGVAQSASLTDLDFGNRAAATAVDLTSTLSNTGSGPLSVTVPTASSVTGTGFSFVSTTCTTSLAVSASCLVTVRFTPTASGPYTGTLTVATGAGNKTASLAGTGLLGAATLSSTSLAFPNVQLGQSLAKTFTLNNNGTQALAISDAKVETGATDYAVSHDCGASVAVNATCTFTVTFAPKTAAALPGSVAITHNGAGGRSTVSLTGTGVAQSGSVNNVAFGNVTVGASSSLTATLSNTGSGPLSVTVPTSASVSGTGFSFVSTNCGTSLAVAGSCVVTVSYAPTAAGGSNGTLTINTGAGALVASLTGTGMGAVLSLTPSTVSSFGNVQVGQIADSVTLTLKNTGTASASALAVNPPTGYTLVSNTCSTTLAASATCSFAVRFSPAAAQPYTNNLTVTATAPVVGTSLALSGTGVAQTATLPNLAFGNLTSGQTSTQQVTLTNTGVGPLSVTVPTAASVTGSGFSFSSTTCGTSLAVGSTCTVSIVFAPTANQGYAGSLSVSTGAGTLTSNLSGTGTRAVLSLTPASMPAFGNVQVGQTADSSTLTLTNSGNATATSLALTPGTAYSVIGSTCGTTLAAGASCTFSLRFAPAAVQAYTTGLTVAAASPAVGTSYAGTGSGVAQSGTLSNVSFGGISAGANSTLTSTLSNTGVGPLSVTVPTASSVTGTGFSFVSTTCGSSLASGNSCTVTVQLSAATNTTYNGTLTVVTGAGSLTSTLSGTGQQAVLALTPSTALAFGTVQVGDFADSAVLTLTNSGNATASTLTFNPPAGYSVQGSNCSTTLAAGANCTFKVRFTPALAQPYSGALSVTAAAPSTGVSLNVGGTGAAQAATLPAVSFGNVNFGSSLDRTSTLTNTGSGALAVTVPTSSSVAGSGFSFVSTTCGTSLPVNGNCTVTVRYAPTNTGSQAGTLTVQTGAGALTSNLSGSGLGSKATLTSSSTVDFGTLAYGATQPTAAVTVRNDGTAAMNLSASPDAPFAVSASNCSNVAVGASCTMTLTMGTSSIGTFNSSVSLTGGATGPVSVTLSGTVNGSKVTASGSTDLSFDRAAYGGTEPTASVTVRNSGNTLMTLTPTGFDPSKFAVASNSCINVPASTSCTVVFKMLTTTVGVASGTFSLEGSTSGAMFGTMLGIVEGVITTWGSTTLSFGNVTVGQSLSKTVDLTNGGNVTANLQALTNLPVGFTSSGCASVPALSTCTMTITFQPTVASTVSSSSVYPSATNVYTNMLSVSGTGAPAGASVSDFIVDASLNGAGVPRSGCNSVDGCQLRLRNVSGKEVTFNKFEIFGFNGYVQAGMMGTYAAGATSLVTNTWDTLNNQYVAGPTNVLIQLNSINSTKVYSNTMTARWPAYSPPSTLVYLWFAGTATSWASNGYVKVYLTTGQVLTVRVNAAGVFSIESVK